MKGASACLAQARELIAGAQGRLFSTSWHFWGRCLLEQCPVLLSVNRPSLPVDSRHYYVR